MIEVLSPINSSVLAQVGVDSLDEVSRKIENARKAQANWAETAGTERARVLFRIADLIESRLDEISELESRNTGKLLTDTRREVLRAATAFRYYAGWIGKVYGETIPVDTEHLVYTLREPVGIVAGIIPWNVPFFFAAKKVAPALAFGNACVLKPALETPLTAMLLHDIAQEAGVPDALFSVAIGDARVGEALVESPNVDLVVFTGSDVSGEHVARSASKNLTPVALELGGKSPQILFPDADVDKAIAAISNGIFASCGQMCIAGSRLIVHKSIHPVVLERLANYVQTLKVGDPFDPTTDVGPQTTLAQRNKTLKFIEEAEQQGVIVAQSELPDNPELQGGYFVPPTIFDSLENDAKLLREEAFGPILAVSSFENESEAIELANATQYGLAAGVWTSDVSRAHRIAASIHAGTIWINSYRVMSDSVPFGGMRRSGYGRENGSEAALLYTRQKSVWTSIGPS